MRKQQRRIQIEIRQTTANDFFFLASKHHVNSEIALTWKKIEQFQR